MRLALLWLAALLAAPASAAVEVSPIHVALTRATPNALVTLVNTGADEARFELQLVSWQQDESGKMKLENTKDVTLYPPLVALKPGERRNARVGVLPSVFGTVEKTYRLIVQELPHAQKAVTRQVQVLTRISIPVFVAPEQPRPDLRVDGVALANGRATFRVVNAGNVRQRPIDVTIDALDAAGAPVASERWEGWYVLPGGRREYAWPVPAGACKRIASFSVEVKLESRVLVARSEAPRGACGE